MQRKKEREKGVQILPQNVTNVNTKYSYICTLFMYSYRLLRNPTKLNYCTYTLYTFVLCILRIPYRIYKIHYTVVYSVYVYTNDNSFYCLALVWKYHLHSRTPNLYVTRIHGDCSAAVGWLDFLRFTSFGHQ